MAEDRQRVRRLDGGEECTHASAEAATNERDLVVPGAQRVTRGAQILKLRHGRAADRPDAIWTGGRFPTHVLQEVDVDAAPAVLHDLDRDELGRALARGLPELEDEVARLVEGVLPGDRDPDVDPPEVHLR